MFVVFLFSIIMLIDQRISTKKATTKKLKRSIINHHYSVNLAYKKIWILGSFSPTDNDHKLAFFPQAKLWMILWCFCCHTDQNIAHSCIYRNFNMVSQFVLFKFFLDIVFQRTSTFGSNTYFYFLKAFSKIWFLWIILIKFNIFNS